MKSPVLVIAFVLVLAGGARGGKVLEQALNILIRFQNKAVLNIIKDSKAHETHRQPINSKQDNAPVYMALQDDVTKRELDLNSKVFRTAIYSIPVDDFMTQAMFAILGEGGILNQGGFYMDGEIRKDGKAGLTLAKSFNNRTEFIDELEKARNAPLQETPISVVTNLLIAPADLNDMIEWQRAKIAQGVTTQDDLCAPKLIIMYYCCTKTADPYLGPLFSTLKAGCD
ncbi:uncharacterized protein LOC116603409 [Nematostella vectensis]|uniref:uncharacterized protein LOC116603409 n=1 Tax=Nematostella vectensis TaxID=45351 RepID=UPI0020771C88|nr:uncharacterized protein LOC116603409 [Nematostella vectensis]